MIQPKDAGIMVEIVNAVSAGVRRPIQFFHLPVPETGQVEDGRGFVLLRRLPIEVTRKTISG